MEEETKPLIGRLKRHASGETECFEEEWVTEAVDLMNEAARDLTDAQARIAELETALRLVKQWDDVLSVDPTAITPEPWTCIMVAVRNSLEKPHA